MGKKRENIIMIAPSYKCNAACNYCYAKDCEDIFQKDMDLLTFADVVDNHKKVGGTIVSIIGGEPSIWKPINKAIMYCKLKGIEVKFFTNGIKPVKTMPSMIYLNINHYFESAKKNFVKKTIEYYWRKKVQIIFRYNLLETEDWNVLSQKIDEIIKMAVKNNSEIHFALVIPFKIGKKNGRTIFDAIKKVIESGVKCYSPNSLPPCMFDPDKLAYLKKNAGFYSMCKVGFAPLINPDGETIQPCSKWKLYKNIEKTGWPNKKIAEIYQKEFEAVRERVPSKCKSCGYFKEKKCNVMCWNQVENISFEN
jgi:MoaA/NifB/PqqE/SkfB family radical SAM enzyme